MKTVHMNTVIIAYFNSTYFDKIRWRLVYKRSTKR